MAINIDSVYQTVQALANKEQRGYLTPQEFNLFANQAAMDIFEQYIIDLGVALREQGSIQRIFGDKVQRLKMLIASTDGVTLGLTQMSNTSGSSWGFGFNSYETITGEIFAYDPNGDARTVRLSTPDEIADIQGSKWHAEGSNNEVLYHDDGSSVIQVHTASGPVTSADGWDVKVERIIGGPITCYWGYVVVNEKPVYDPASSINIPLNRSERSDVVTSILKLAGISIEKPQLAQMAGAEEGKNIQQENK